MTVQNSKSIWNIKLKVTVIFVCHCLIGIEISYVQEQFYFDFELSGFSW